MVDSNKNFIPLPRKALSKVIAEEEANGRKLAEEEWVDLIFRGIQDIDNASINYFKVCTKLSLSSNLIQRIPEIQLDNLKILSLGRNKIKYIKNLDYVAKTLTELWISYNEIERLDTMKNLVNLEKFYIGNNMIQRIDELNNLSGLTNLRDVVFKGNPFCLVDGNITKPMDLAPGDIHPEIKKRVPSVTMIDGHILKEI